MENKNMFKAPKLKPLVKSAQSYFIEYFNEFKTVQIKTAIAFIFFSNVYKRRHVHG